MRTAVFLDRDGVVIENREQYVRDWSDVEFLPGALEALARLSRTEYAVVLVTNQSAVGRGIISHSKALEVHEMILAEIQTHGGRVEGSFLCPHAPWENCPCRKPRPGLLLEAAMKLALDMSRSIMVGDALTDIEAGKQAGVGRCVLVRTGRGNHQIGLAEAQQIGPFDVFPSLAVFIDHLLAAT